MGTNGKIWEQIGICGTQGKKDGKLGQLSVDPMHWLSCEHKEEIGHNMLAQSIAPIAAFWTRRNRQQQYSVNNFNKSLQQLCDAMYSFNDTSDDSADWAGSSSPDEEDLMEAAAAADAMFVQSVGSLLLGADQMGMLDTAPARAPRRWRVRLVDRSKWGGPGRFEIPATIRQTYTQNITVCFAVA